MDTKDHKSTVLPGLNTDQLKDIEERLSEVKERTSEFVKKYPMTSIAIAAGVGFIIGKILSGKTLVNDLFKIGEFFLNYFVGRGNLISEKSLEISAEILNQLRRILILVVLTLGSLALFCMGMSHLIERFLNNIDNGAALFTPSIWFILGFLIICIGVMVYATNKSNWLDIFKAEKKDAPPPVPAGGNQLESVISLLILDFIKEREAKRAQTKPNGSKDE